MTDLTENYRRMLIATGQPHKELAKALQRWDTEQLKHEFIVNYFLAPFVCVTRKKDGAEGTMMFTHHPRWYFNFLENKDTEHG